MIRVIFVEQRLPLFDLNEIFQCRHAGVPVVIDNPHIQIVSEDVERAGVVPVHDVIEIQLDGDHIDGPTVVNLRDFVLQQDQIDVAAAVEDQEDVRQREEGMLRGRGEDPLNESLIIGEHQEIIALPAVYQDVALADVVPGDVLHQIECFESRKAEVGRPIVGLRDIPIVADDVHAVRIQIHE